MNTAQSKELFQRAERVMVGGVNSPVRAFKSVGGDPLFMKSGQGAYFFDQDNNRYTDYCLSWGALIHGHAHPDVTRAVKDQIKNGTSFGTSTAAEVSMAEWIVQHVPSVDMVRFVNSGTEATMSAIRLARGYTGRSKVVKFDGCYHGHVDDLLTTAGSGVATLASSSSQGIPRGHIENTLSLHYNDIETVTRTLETEHEDIACVILEPVAGNMGVIVPDMAFIQALRELTERYGIILIFDEVMTGFRTSLGCVQGDYGITPDLTCMGKIIGGGFPVGAYGGREHIMRHLAPLGGVYQAGTFSGNPIVMRAGLTSLETLSEEELGLLNRRAEEFSITLNHTLEQHNVPAHLSHYYGMLSLRFRKQPVRNYDDARAASSDSIYAHLFQYLLKQGMYFPPADLEAFFISTVHSDEDLNTLKGHLETFLVSHLPDLKILVAG